MTEPAVVVLPTVEERITSLGGALGLHGVGHTCYVASIKHNVRVHVAKCGDMHSTCMGT